MNFYLYFFYLYFVEVFCWEVYETFDKFISEAQVFWWISRNTY